jgi:hypothetical protein
MSVGDSGEMEAERLLTQRGWSVVNLNSVKRNHKLYDLTATKNGKTIRVSVKVARAKRNLRLGNPRIFQSLDDHDFIIAFLRKASGEEFGFPTSCDVWIIPGVARHDALHAHLHYYGHDEAVAFQQSNMMVKDKMDREGGRSISGAVFKSWEEKYRNAWDLLPA